MRNLIYIIITFLFLFYPTSSNGIIRNTVGNVVFDWAIVFILMTLVLIFYGELDRKNAIISSLIFVYLFLITLISNIADPNSSFSIARVAPICLFLLLSSMKVNLSIPMKRLFLFFDIVIGIIIVCNILILFENSFIKKFIIDNYSQLYENATENMFIKRRPVFTFGIYTFASYFYSLIFLLSISSYTITKKYKYKLYCYVLLILNILLVSNFSILSSVFMTSVLFYFTIKNKNLFEIFIFTVLISIVLFWLFNNKELISYYTESLLSRNNGVIGRYSSTGTLAVNSKYLKRHPIIGFNIIRNIKLTYTDSAYFVLRLMGGWILLMPYYYLLYRFMRNNFKESYIVVLIITVVFEIALPVSIYIKFASGMLFCIIYLNSLRLYKTSIIKTEENIILQNTYTN